MAFKRLGNGVVVIMQPNTTQKNIIDFDQVFLGWHNHIALRDINGSFVDGTMTAVVGPNGAGKSTFIKAIMGQINPIKGSIYLSDNVENQIACMPQFDQMDKSFPITLYDMVALGAWNRVGAWDAVNNNEHDLIMQALEQVGLIDFSRRIIGTLSGGQMQRALFARLLLHDAKVMLLDEPFAAVDRDTTEELLALLHDWHAQGKTIIAVLHDLEMVKKHFPQSLLLARQMVAWGNTNDVLTADNLHLARHLCAGDF